MMENALDRYDPLKDRHLTTFFSNPKLQKHLKNMGLLFDNGQPVTYSEYYKWNKDRKLRSAQRRQMNKDIIIKHRDFQLGRQLELQRQLDGVEKVAVYRRIKGDFHQEQLVQVKPMDVARTLHRAKSSPGGHGRQQGAVASSDSSGYTSSKGRPSSGYHTDDEGQRPMSVERRVQRASLTTARAVDDSGTTFGNSHVKRYLDDVYRHQFLHKLDQPSLLSYGNYLRRKLNRIERFRETLPSISADSSVNGGSATPYWNLRRSSTPPTMLRLPSSHTTANGTHSRSALFTRRRMITANSSKSHSPSKLTSNNSSAAPSAPSSALRKTLPYGSASSSERKRRTRSTSAKRDSLLPPLDSKNGTNGVKRVIPRRDVHMTSAAARRHKNFKPACVCFLQYRGPSNRQQSRSHGDDAEADSTTVLIQQQHCSGPPIVVFKKQLKPANDFYFFSYRHVGFPFTLVIQENGEVISRLSACCESRYQPNVLLGGKQGCFKWLGVRNAMPCYKCQVDREMETPYTNYTPASALLARVKEKEKLLSSPNAMRPSTTLPLAAARITRTNYHQQISSADKMVKKFEQRKKNVQRKRTDGQKKALKKNDKQITGAQDNTSDPTNLATGAITTGTSTAIVAVGAEKRKESEQSETASSASAASSDNSRSTSTEDEEEQEKAPSTLASTPPGVGEIESHLREIDEEKQEKQREEDQRISSEEQASTKELLTTSSDNDSKSEMESSRNSLLSKGSTESEKRSETPEKVEADLSKVKDQISSAESSRTESETKTNTKSGDSATKSSSSRTSQKGKKKDIKERVNRAGSALLRLEEKYFGDDEKGKNGLSEQTNGTTTKVTFEEANAHSVTEIKSTSKDESRPVEIVETESSTPKVNDEEKNKADVKSESESESESDEDEEEETETQEAPKQDKPTTSAAKDSTASSQRKASSDAEEWQCQECNFDNPGDNSTCRICNAARSGNHSDAAEDEDEEEDEEEETSEDEQSTEKGSKHGERSAKSSMTDEGQKTEASKVSTTEGVDGTLKNEMDKSEQEDEEESEDEDETSSEESDTLDDAQSIHEDANHVNGQPKSDNPVDRQLQSSIAPPNIRVLPATPTPSHTFQKVTEQKTSVASSGASSSHSTAHSSKSDTNSHKHSATTGTIQQRSSVSQSSVTTVDEAVERFVGDDVTTSGLNLGDLAVARDTADHLAGNSAIKSLSFRSTDMTPETLKLISTKMVYNRAPIRVLNFNGNKLTAAAVPDVIRIVKGRPIEILTIHDNQLGDEGCSQLVNELQRVLPKSSSQLKRLDLGENNLGSATASAVGQLISNSTTLKAINLSGSKDIDSTAWKQLSDGLAENDSIESIHLDYCSMGDDNAKLMFEALKGKSSLKYLDVDGNNLTDSSAVALLEMTRQCPNVQNVVVMAGNSLSSERQSALSKILAVKAARGDTPEKDTLGIAPQAYFIK